VDDGEGGGGEAVGGEDDLVPGTDPGGPEGELEGGRARPDADAVGGAAEGGELGLEGGDLGPEGERARGEEALEGGPELAGQGGVLAPEGDEPDRGVLTRRGSLVACLG
jgi:hypothetical protein